jgi:hypothetical protein
MILLGSMLHHRSLLLLVNSIRRWIFAWPTQQRFRSMMRARIWRSPSCHFTTSMRCLPPCEKSHGFLNRAAACAWQSCIQSIRPGASKRPLPCTLRHQERLPERIHLLGHGRARWAVQPASGYRKLLSGARRGRPARRSSPRAESSRSCGQLGSWSPLAAAAPILALACSPAASAVGP